MSARIPDTHAEAWALLPWLANGRIQASDREWVEAHVAGCAECRAELAAQRMVATQMTARCRGASPEPPASDEQRSFNKLWARIEAAESASPPVSGTGSAALPAPRASRTVRWLAAAVVVQGFGLGAVRLQRAAHDSQPARLRHGRRRSGAARSTRPRCASCSRRKRRWPPSTRCSRTRACPSCQARAPSGNFTAELSADAVASGASADSVAAVISKDPNVTFAQPVAR